MPPKQKGEVMEDKNEAPPAEGEKQIKKEKTPDQGKTGQKTLGKRTSRRSHRGEMPKKIKGKEGEAVVTRPTLIIGYNAKMPCKNITEDEYDAWFNSVECGNETIKPFKSETRRIP